jgi:hypothetical protein
VALFVKRHGGTDKHSIFGRLDPVEHGSDISVVADVVGASSIDGDGGICCKFLRGFCLILNRHIQDFHIAVLGDEGSSRRGQLMYSGRPGQGLPHESRSQLAVVLRVRELLRLLFCGGSGSRVHFAAALSEPEVAGGTIIMKVLGAYRFQQKGLLVDLGIAAKAGGDGAFQPAFGCKREVQVTCIFRLSDQKTAVFIHKFQLIQ